MRVAERRLGSVVQNTRTTGVRRPDQTEIHHPVFHFRISLVVCFSAGKSVELEQPVHLSQAVFQAVLFHRVTIIPAGLSSRLSTTVKTRSATADPISCFYGMQSNAQ